MTLPPDIVALLLRAHPDFEAVASFAADISPDGRLTADWLEAGPAGVALIRNGGVTLLAADEIDSIATHRYLSGGRLVTQRNGSVRLLARYSGARLAAAEEFAQAANRVLRSGAPGAPEQEASPTAEPVVEPVQEAASAAGGRVLPRLFAMMPASKYWRVPVIAGALAAGAGAAVLAPLLAGQFLFDEVLAPEGRFAGRLLLAVGLILLALLVEVAAKVTWGWTNAAFIHDLEVTLKRSAFGSLQRLSMRFYSARHTGEMMTRLEQDASDIALLFHIVAPSALTGGLFLAGSLVAMLALDWQLAAAAILPFPLLFIVFRRIIPEVSSYFDRLFRAEAELRTVTSDSLTGARVVRAFGHQQRELERFAAPNRAAARLGYLADAMVGTTQPPIQLVTELVLVAVWAAGAWAVTRDQVSVGVLVTFAGYLSRFFWPVGGLLELAQDWGRVASAARQLLTLIDAPPDLPQPTPSRHRAPMQGGVALERVSFSYTPGQPALQQVSLHAAAGEMIGLVGHTGAGKSTVINLLLRLYDVDGGAVTLDGIDLRDLEPATLRRQVSVVLQDPFLFSGTVADNIRYAKPDAADAGVVQAARIAQAYDFVMGFPDGFDTVVGERGQRLSGGERQRISIARAILRDPRILILDEATSALDLETEERFHAALEALTADGTVIAITHRLATLRRAQRLVVIEAGRIAESGTHDELLAAGGRYRRMVEAQRALADARTLTHA